MGAEADTGVISWVHESGERLLYFFVVYTSPMPQDRKKTKAENPQSLVCLFAFMHLLPFIVARLSGEKENRKEKKRVRDPDWLVGARASWG